MGGVEEEKEEGAGRRAEGEGRERNSRDAAGKDCCATRDNYLSRMLMSVIFA